MFSCRLETSAFIPLGLFAFIVCERVPTGLLWIRFFSEVSNSGEQHVFCFSQMECELCAQQPGANQ